MSSPLSAIARLRRCAAVLAEHGGEDGEWFAQKFALFEVGVDWEKAFDLRPAPGQESWRTREARKRRDDLLRDLGKRFFPGRGAAGDIADAISRYETAQWRRDEKEIRAPEAYRHKKEEIFFQVLKTGLPVSKRTVERALSTIPPNAPRIDGGNYPLSSAIDEEGSDAEYHEKSSATVA